MFYLNREVELNASLLQKMINKFHVGVEPKLNKRKHYYDGIRKILSKNYTDETKHCLSGARTSLRKDLIYWGP